MHEVTLLINIAVALVAAFCGGVIARRLGLPTIVGYLLAGMAIGPFTPGFVGDVETISQLAELGVIFLMFGVGIHFSLSHLWAVRALAVPGALGRMVLIGAFGFALANGWGWSYQASLVLGVAVSIASTIVMLRGLTDFGYLNSSHGRMAVGWTIVEDIATVLILVMLPALTPTNQAALWQTTSVALAKAALFAALMLLVGVRLVPWLLLRIARTRSRELFILAIVAVALGTAVASAELFGVSLALGAFLAGVVVSENQVSHQVGAEIVPFQETFAVLFFVSVGMLVDPRYLINQAGHILAITALIVVGKSVIAAGITFLSRSPVRTGLVIGAGSSQIGEFSFIVGQMGLGLNLINMDQYSLILAGALLSITVNPLVFRAIPRIEGWLEKRPTLWALINRHSPEPDRGLTRLIRHVVIVGYGRVGHHIVDVLTHLGVPLLVVDRDAALVAELNSQGIQALFGDAANSLILDHAGLDRAIALVVTVPDEVTTEMVVATARQIQPQLPIIARAGSRDGPARLAALGARHVIYPEFEGGLEVVRLTLLLLGYPHADVQQYTDTVRQDHYETSINTPNERQALDQLIGLTHHDGQRQRG